MNLSITLLGLSLVIISIAPIVYAVLKKSREGKKLQQVFNKMILAHNLDLSEKDSWNDRFIGVDVKSKKVLFVSSEFPEGTLIDLNSVSSFNITKEGENSQGIVKKEVVGNLGLQFGIKRQQNPVHLTFYNIDTDDLLQANFHKQLISKWHQLIKDAMPMVKRQMAA